MSYAIDIVKDGLSLTEHLNGRQQLCLIRKVESGIEYVYLIYNYVIETTGDSVGLCFVFYDRYPQNVNYFFSFCGHVISQIINEGKILYLDLQGNIQANQSKKTDYSSSLKKHLTDARRDFDLKKAELSKVPPTFFSNYQDQHAIFQLSDNSWTMSDALLYNNIVIITKEVEEENINKVVNIIKGQNDNIQAKDKQLEKKNKEIEQLINQNTDKDKQIQELKEKLRKSEEANQKQSGYHGAESFNKQKETETKKKTSYRTEPNSPVKPAKKKKDIEWGLYAFIGITSLLILFCLIVPWFIPGLLPKLAVALTGVAVVLLILVIFDVFTESDNIIFYVCLLAILLSSLMTGYGLIWGFPSHNNDKAEQETTVKVLDKKEKKAWRKTKQLNTLDAYKTFVENNGQSKYVEDALYKIVRFARANYNTSGLSYVINYEDSCRTNNCLPYDTISTPGAEARDSVVLLCKIWVSSASNLKKRISKYSFDRDYSNEKEQEYLGKMVKDALALDSIWRLMDNEFNRCDEQKNECQYVVYEMNGVFDSVFLSLKIAQDIFTIGKSKLSDGEYYATDENKSFYNQAIECVDKYFDKRHYSGM